MNTPRTITISNEQKARFTNNMDYCIGTGRLGLALGSEYQKQLQLVQKTIGFSHIRGHGLFCDDLAICQSWTDADGNKQYEYNFTYLDLVFDSYLELGIKPFLELGFMPSALASGSQTVFHWKGNVTPPEDYKAWEALVTALLEHLIERYGREEVTSWPIEVWNEPNLKGFWKDADMDEYFTLYAHSAAAVKAVDPRFRVGGPAICGVDDEHWTHSFLAFIRDHKLPLDFFTRHHYTSEFPQRDGHYSYIKLHDIDEAFQFLERTRSIIDSYPQFKDIEIHITEFNTSYVPDCPLHDTNLNAAYTAALLARLGDCHASYSYWTFGDIFEEKGVPFTPFHGGFGLVANGCIPKPTFWTFAFHKELQGQALYRDSNTLVLRRADDSLCGMLWNPDPDCKRQQLDITLQLPVDVKETGGYCLLVKTVDEESCNPLKLWHDLGEPAQLSPWQLKQLQDHAVPQLRSTRITAENGQLEAGFALKPNAVVYFELNKAEIKSDRGFDYTRVMGGDS